MTATVNESTFTTPLDNDSRTDEVQNSPKPRRTPLPMFQLFIILLIQSTEPVTATVIYPFINQFVRDTGVTRGDERKTGYYAGFIESAFFVAEAATVYLWGRASDIHGRRPILLIGPIGLSLAMLGFGLSTRFWTLVVSRCMQGVFNGNIGVSKSMMAEITDKTNIADAYSMMPLMWSFGSTLGPILGGVLSQPAKTWPTLFGKVLFWHHHPYFLPCAVAALISTVSASFAFVGLKETLPAILHREKQRNPSVEESYSDSTTGLLTGRSETSYGSTTLNGCSTEAATLEETPPTPVAFKDLFTPQVLLTLCVQAFLSFVDMSCQVLLPLLWSTSPELGGLGFDPFLIGTIMGTFGVLNAIIQLTFLARAIRVVGARNMQIVGHTSFVLILSLYPLLRFFAKRADRRVWVVLVTQLVLSVPINGAYASIQILTLDSAPNRASIGATNGMAQSLSSAMRSIAPSVASSLFSISLQRQLLGGNMVFLVLGCTALIGVRLTLLLPKQLRS